MAEEYINTIDSTNFEGQKTVLNAINNAVSLKDIKGSIDVCDCITMAGKRKGRNGASDSDCQNTYLITPDGTAYFTQSDGIARSVRAIAKLIPDFGKSTDKGFITLAVYTKPLDNGNTVKTLVMP